MKKINFYCKIKSKLENTLNLLGFLNKGPLAPHPENFVMFFVYMLKSKRDNSLYVGYTNNLKRRFSEHNNGKGLSTKHKSPFDLIYYEAYRSEGDAKYRESNLKRHAQALKALKERTRNSLI